MPITHPARLALVCALAWGAACGAARADVFSYTPDPFPPGSGFPTAGACFPGPFNFCVANLQSANFVPIAAPSFAGGNETVTYQATYTGSFTDPTTHAVLGSFSSLGTDTFEIFGRTSPVSIGTWAAQLLSENVSVSAGGHSISLSLDPGTPSLGWVSIVPVGGINGSDGLALDGPYGDGRTLYDISSFFDVFADFVIDGTPIGDPGGFGISVGAVPEPATLALLGLPLAALARRRR